MSRYSFNVAENKYMDGDEQIGVYDVVSRLNKGLRNVTYKYNLFDSCITENNEPISVSKVLLLLNGDLNCVKDDVDELEKLREENKYLRNKLRVLRNSIGNINNFLNDDGGI